MLRGEKKRGWLCNWKCKENWEEPPEFAISPVHRRTAAKQENCYVSPVQEFEDDSNLGENQTTLILQWIVVSINDDDRYGGLGSGNCKTTVSGSEENFNRPAVPYSCLSDPPDPSLQGFLVSHFLVLVFLNCVHHTLSTAFLPWARSCPNIATAITPFNFDH